MNERVGVESERRLCRSQEAGASGVFFPSWSLGKSVMWVAVFSLTRMAYEPRLARGNADLWALAKETC
ncbi:protein of unknown function [Methylotuvimicrobium alcaliphilum 20Z]|uniref:Uncharacterized protein n=1 Tax=Methylotuvimicrobium alcaliphilum (strain DSM 19304 / NCIMB 14124 / VKM B-2133 / 20Z) TaxID=1091494 RepID=G4T3P0_META2|nr:protein of unknown function [Methylotuvimicrobium alcaliphilum 20Z]